MIEIRNKRDCCGCNACVQKCPQQCIGQSEDAEGFIYPQVDKARCVGCGLCEKVCPVINQNPKSKPLKVMAGRNGNEEIRMVSSSGGAFTLLAGEIIGRGGVVFGARFDENWNVVHSYTECTDGLAAFRGSKYVQSRIGETFSQAEKFLKQGREVLFTGTPCQIAGLRRFLGKEYDNLLSIAPRLDDDKGTGLILVNTVKGKRIYDKLPIISEEIIYGQALKGNHSIEISAPVPPQRECFFENLGKEDFSRLVNRLTKVPLTIRLRRAARRLIKKLR